MANKVVSFGFRPERYANGAKWNGMTALYGVSASQTNNIYIGDVVQFDATNRSTGNVDPYAPGIPCVIPVIAPLTTNTFRGVVAGIVPQPEFNMVATASLGTRYVLASTARYLWVVDDYDVIFMANESNGNSYVSSSSNAINKVADVKYAAGNQQTGISGVFLDETTVTTGATRPFRLLRMTQRIDNFSFATTDANSNINYDVLIANSDLSPANQGA